MGGRFLRIIYNSVLVRDDLEIDNTNVIGTIEDGKIVEAVERVICGANIARYKIKYPLNQDDDMVLESSDKDKSTNPSKMTNIQQQIEAYINKHPSQKPEKTY